MNRVRSKLTYANVISTLCLFLLLGGGAYAASQLPKNSVGTKQLKNGSITLAKLKSSAKKSLKGATGPAGPAGPQGAAGGTNVIVREGEFELGISVALCNPGENVVGGGGFTESAGELLWGSFPNNEPGQKPTGWVAGGETITEAAGVVKAYVLCATP